VSMSRAGRVGAPPRALLVLEQTLGNAVYGALVERAATAHRDIDPEVIRIHYREGGALSRLPGVGSWTVRASLTARSEVRRAMRRRPTDVAFVCTSVPGMLLGDVMTRVPTVISTDATPANFDLVGVAYGHEVGAGLVETIKRTAVARIFRRAAALVAWSEWTARSMVVDYGVPPNRVHRIPPGVDLSLFTAGERPARHGPIRVLFVGSDFERKGGRDLVEVVASLPGTAELDIVTSQAMSGLPPHIRVHRELTHRSPELPALFQAAEVFALPTRGDTYAHVVVEAMAAGLPVISTPVGAIPELLGSGERGVLVPRGDTRALRDALVRLASDRGLARAMGSRAAAYARATHDSDANMGRLMDLLAATAHDRHQVARGRDASLSSHPITERVC